MSVTVVPLRYGSAADPGGAGGEDDRAGSGGSHGGGRTGGHTRAAAQVTNYTYLCPYILNPIR